MPQPRLAQPGGNRVCILFYVAWQALAPGRKTQLDAAALEAIAEDAPTATLPREQVVGAALADIIAATGMQPSKGAAKRMIKVCPVLSTALPRPCNRSSVLHICT